MRYIVHRRKLKPGKCENPNAFQAKTHLGTNALISDELLIEGIYDV